jgi:hypothetical protein
MSDKYFKIVYGFNTPKKAILKQITREWCTRTLMQNAIYFFVLAAVRKFNFHEYCLKIETKQQTTESKMAKLKMLQAWFD